MKVEDFYKNSRTFMPDEFKNNKEMNIYTEHGEHFAETYEKNPISLLVINGGFLGSYLAKHLLELPLRVLYSTIGETADVQHLLTNERFSCNSISEILQRFDQDYEEINYIFQLVDVSILNNAGDDIEKQIHNILNLAIRHHAKYQLVVSGVFSDNDIYRSEKTRGDAGLFKEDPITKINKIQKHIIDFSKQNNLNFRITRILDLYGPKMILDSSWELPLLLRSVKKKEPLIIQGEGLLPLFPIYANDAANGVIKAMFADATSSQTLCIASPQEITALNLTYKLREILIQNKKGLFELLFSGLEKKSENLQRHNNRLKVKSNIIETLNLLGWKPEVSLDEGLFHTINWLDHRPDLIQLQSISSGVQGQPIQSKPRPPRKKIKIKVLKKKWILSASLLTLLFLSLSPLIIFISLVGLASFRLHKSYQLLKSGNFQESIIVADKSSKNFYQARSQLTSLTAILPSRNNLYEKSQVISDYLELGYLLSQALHHSAQSIEYGLNLKEFMLTQSDVPLDAISNKLTPELSAIYSKLSYALALINQSSQQNTSFDLLVSNSSFQNFEKKIEDLRQQIIDIRQVVDLIPEIFGSTGKRTYLILLQNNSELRPTGGFIGSYALLNFNNAQLSSLQVEDVYTADGQLKGHVEPPEEIKKYLGEAGWYLRDANWDPNFPSAAQQIEWFFEKETGIKVDGTIAINLFVVKEILRALGPLKLDDYNEVISADNLFSSAEYYSEMNFFPGSTQKKDFLASLMNSIFYEIKHADISKAVRLFQALHISLERGQLLVFFHDKEVNRIMNQLGWDGSLEDISCSDKNLSNGCYPQYLSLREANVGVNKANYFITRNLAIHSNILDDSVETTITISYKNLSPGNSWPGGSYKNYLRLYINAESKVTKLSVDGETLTDAQYKIKKEHGKQAVGLLIIIPPKSETTVELQIQQKQLTFPQGKAEIAFLLEKQSGTDADPLTYTLSFPQEVTIEQTNIPLRIKEKAAKLNQNLSTDLLLIIDLRKTEMVK